MSIATVLQRLSAAKTAIASAITAKGGTVGAGDGLEDFAAAIAAIPSGGGGITGTEMILAVDCDTWKKLLDALYPVQTGLERNAVYIIVPKTRSQIDRSGGVYFFGFTTNIWETSGDLNGFCGCRHWGGAPNTLTSLSSTVAAYAGDAFVEYILPLEVN